MIKNEVHRSKYAEDTYHDFHIYTSIICYTFGMDHQTSGAYTAHGRYQRIESRHLSGKIQHEKFDYSECKVCYVKYFRRIAYSYRHFFKYRAGCFSSGYELAVYTQRRQYGYDEYQYTHSAEPVRYCFPEQQCMAECGVVRSAPRCREAGCRFEKSSSETVREI